MDRHLLLLLLCHVAAPAPQAITDSDITYVKLQPPIEAPTASSHYRESRIENLPLTIPGNLTFDEQLNEAHKNETRIVTDEFDTQSTELLPESTNVSDSIALPDDKTEEINTTDGPDEQASVIAETTVISDETDELRNSKELGTDLSVPSETYLSDRQGRTYDTTDIFEDVTEKFEDITQIPIVKTKPKFSKLSYFQKQKPFGFAKNAIERTPLRRFRSHCRCEKIWNCPKLQISVPRCPNEYFLCCF